jgi:hypothetical protein
MIRGQRFPASYPSEGMTCWPVSTRVGNVKNNDPSLIAFTPSARV